MRYALTPYHRTINMRVQHRVCLLGKLRFFGEIALDNSRETAGFEELSDWDGEGYYLTPCQQPVPGFVKKEYKMVLPNDSMDDNPAGETESELDATFIAFENAAAIYPRAIESGRDQEVRRENPELTLAWWDNLRLLGKGQIARADFLKWLLWKQQH